MIEKRRRPRHKINQEFQSLEAFLREYATDLSLQGVFIRTSDLLPVGTLVDLNFSVIIDDIETIKGEGRVVHVVAEGLGQPPGMGLSFVALDEDSRSVLRRVVEQRQQILGL